jgi:hypothetical protein
LCLDPASWNWPTLGKEKYVLPVTELVFTSWEGMNYKMYRRHVLYNITEQNITQTYTNCLHIFRHVTQIGQRRAGTVLPPIKDKIKQAVVCVSGAWIIAEL